MPSSNLRVVVACVTFETVMVVEPVKHYKADRVYLLHQARKEPYTDFLNEVEAQLEPVVKDRIKREIKINNSRAVMKEVLGIIRNEKAEGNHVYVNVAAGPNVFAAAALIACMMEGAVAFNVWTEKYTVDPKRFYVDGRPVGMSKKVMEPIEVPMFEIKAPRPELVAGLRAWARMSEQRGLMSTANIIKKLEGENLISGVCDDRKRVTQAGVMKYRRNFLEQWLRRRWLVKDGKTMRLTEEGKGVLEMF
jgi:hypothetical protein